MEKTIQGLNQKAWYRLLKVLFFLLLLFVVLVYNFFVLIAFEFNPKSVNQNRTVISCNIGDQKSFNPNTIGIAISDYHSKQNAFDYRGYFEDYNDYDIREIIGHCTGKEPIDTDAFVIQRAFEYGKQIEGRTPLTLADLEERNISGIREAIFPSEKARLLDWDYRMFEVDTRFTYLPFFSWSIFGTLAILGVFEIFRRVFYYVLLGSFRPKKN